MEQYFNDNPYLNINPAPPPPLSPPPLLLPQVGDDGRDKDRERLPLPQWIHAETAEFLAIRSELDCRFMATKRNKPLWEEMSNRLRCKGFFRTAEQCKSKWKNLVTRFKQDANKQFPFHEEMRRIFSKRMERVLSSDTNKEGNEEEEEEEEKMDERSKRKGGVVKKKKKRKELEEEVAVALKEFVRRQAEREAWWVEAAEAREAERRVKEEEWRSAMAALSEERVAMERRWREREEERRSREEVRAERRHALIMSLLNKLANEEA
ncbi:trihelix transcription factor GT-3b-like isoform X2 [Ananas comosus]|uniref:Trihelix transcription factor GT-3b-like isoform X2 n=1 Tax=Ananas comosus TaxID=4615 RepID=A0A6P5F1L1_ANACO|nr:trihelix transcription factor GT-3b-like isoform X2 [Ananas comosus]